jgi:chromosomal replication initiator protein
LCVTILTFVSTFQLDSGVIMPELWTTAVAEIKERIGKQNFETWIKPISFVSRNKNEILLEVPSKFFREWLMEHYLAQIETVLSSLAKHDVKVVFEINDKLDSPSNIEKPLKKDEKEREKPQRNNNLVAKYTFQNFVVGASNQFAHAACVAVANQPGDHYNPLFIYGGVGLGKTHLVNAIGHQAVAQRPGLKVVYLSSESFMNELIASLRRDKMDEFKKKFRNVDILILDDVQFIAGKERTQEEKKAEDEGVELPQEVGFFLASNIDSNVRELEGSLTRLGAFASLTKVTITVDLAKDVLRNTLKSAQREITVENIQKTICDYFNLKIGDLKAKRRTQNIAMPRQVAMYLCRKYTETSFPAIGDKFGGRDHSTVIHASKTIERKIKEDPHMQTTIEKLERNLNIRKRL